QGGFLGMLLNQNQNAGFQHQQGPQQQQAPPQHQALQQQQQAPQQQYAPQQQQQVPQQQAPQQQQVQAPQQQQVAQQQAPQQHQAAYQFLQGQQGGPQIQQVPAGMGQLDQQVGPVRGLGGINRPMGHAGINMGPALEQQQMGFQGIGQQRHPGQAGMGQFVFNVPGHQTNAGVIQGGQFQQDYHQFQAGMNPQGNGMMGGRLGTGVLPGMNMDMVQPTQGTQAGMGQPMIIAPAGSWDTSKNTLMLQGTHLDSHIGSSLRQKIINDEYVDFATLAKDENKQILQCNTQKNEDGSTSVVLAPSDKKKKIWSVSEWQNAFYVFMTVYVPYHPNETLKLFKYGAHILSLSLSPGADWVKYDENFRRNKKFGLDWAVPNNELMLAATLLKSPNQNSAQNNKRSGANVSSFRDGKPICIRWNKGHYCNFSECKYRHVCSDCGQFHRASGCSSKSGYQNQNKSQNKFSPKAPYTHLNY
ncbi:unnamed protein product, partial [Owenia fusiformis]